MVANNRIMQLIWIEADVEKFVGINIYNNLVGKKNQFQVRIKVLFGVFQGPST